MKLTEDTKKIIVTCIRKGYYKNMACQQARVSSPALQQWLKIGKDNRENKDNKDLSNYKKSCVDLVLRLEESEAEFLNTQLNTIKEVASGNNFSEVKQVFYDADGNVEKTIIKTTKEAKSFPAAAWLIERRFKEYRLQKEEDTQLQNKNDISLSDLASTMLNSIVPLNENKEN